MSEHEDSKQPDDDATGEAGPPVVVAADDADDHARADGPRRSADAESAKEASDGGSRRGILSGFVPKLAIAVAIVAVLIASALWWQYRQFYVELANKDAFLLESIEDTRANLRGLEDELGSLREALNASDTKVEGVKSDVEVLPAEIRALGRRIDALQGGQIDARDSWLREQAEYYLVLANSELAVGHHVGNAIKALELADDVLRDLGDPALADVRNAVATELQDLRAVPVPDLERYAADLGGLMTRAQELPMRAESPQNFEAPDASGDDAEPGLGRLWARTRGAVTSIVRVERAEEPVGPILTEEERQISRRQLTLELQLARTAAIERRQAAFRASLVAADAILNRDFDRSAPSVIEARRLLGNLMQAELDPALPDIGDSLTLLRNTPGAA
jgi:uroporphyrin-III C-methyltransferase